MVKMILRTALALVVCLSVSYAQNKNAGFKKIFDGKTMKGWKGDTEFWRIENGCFVGEVTPEKPLSKNTFLIWQGGNPGDFEFKAMYRISADGNSGINYRSEMLSDVPFGVRGYQADIDGADRYTGQNYEERGRGFLAKRGEKALLKEGQKPLITGSVGDPDALKASIKSGEWNEIHIIAKGNHLRHYINGVLMSEVIDEDQKLGKSSGVLGLQVHVAPKMKVEYKEIYIRQ